MLSQNWSALFIGLVAVVVLARYANAALWTPVRKSKTLRRSTLSQPQLRIQDSLSMQLNASALSFDTNDIDGSVLLDIPFPDGKIIPFKLFPSDVLPAELSAKYPEIKAFSGYNAGGGEQLHAEVDYTPEKGFHAYILGNSQDIYIDPFNIQENEYKVYTKQEYQTASKTIPQNSWNCKAHGFQNVSDPLFDPLRNLQGNTRVRQNVRQVRFTMALVANAEYSSYHGNTVSGILAAMVTAIQRVSGIYKRSVGVSFLLHPRTDELICLRPCSGLGAGYGMLSEIVPYIQSKNIASNTYDLAHGFSTTGGGVATLFSLCGSGAGLTGNFDPVGDPFWVDYVAHEVGHQFGAYHTFSDCGTPSENPIEPGSGTTIMGYAGICGQNDVQSVSDPMFHSKSFEEMLDHVDSVTGNSQCGSLFNTVSSLPSGIVQPSCRVPHSTFFRISIDPATVDGNAWYGFEPISGVRSFNQYFDRSIPGIRARVPVKRSYRDFPNLFYIINGASDDVLDEVLPSRDQQMTFRALARSSYSATSLPTDASISSGFIGVKYSDMVVDFGGPGTAPFTISPFAKQQQWRANSMITLEWTGGLPNTNLRLAIAKHDQRMDWNNFSVGVDVIDWENQIVDLDWKVVVGFPGGNVDFTNSIDVLLPNLYSGETTVHAMIFSTDTTGCYYFDIIPYIQYLN